jgi:hypothetical protein
MIPWIQVYSNLIRHPKVTKFADKLNLTSKDAGANVIAAGMLVSLWLWAAQNATDGDLSECSDRAIAEAAEFKRKPSLFVEALIHAKLLDEDRRLHDWDEYATLLIDYEEQQREKTRKRVEKHRAKKKALQSVECNVTETPCNAPTKPNLTLPNLTLQNISGDDGDTAREREASESELLSIGIKPGEYSGMTTDLVDEIKVTTYKLFCKYLPAAFPQPWDYRQVAQYCGPVGREHLLDYAFEQAGVSGKLGDWRYINGIMDRLAMRGINTVEQARLWDAERPDLEQQEV